MLLCHIHAALDSFRSWRACVALGIIPYPLNNPGCAADGQERHRIQVAGRSVFRYDTGALKTLKVDR
jgi:hypothetical protein